MKTGTALARLVLAAFAMTDPVGAADHARADLARIQPTGLGGTSVATRPVTGILRSAVADLDVSGGEHAVVLRPPAAPAAASSAVALELWLVRSPCEKLPPCPAPPVCPPAPTLLQELTLPFPAVDVALADVDGDGRLDAVVAGRKQGIAVYHYLGPTFDPTPVLVPAPRLEPRLLETGDLDGDGRGDVVACGTGCAVLWGGPGPSLSPPDPLPVGRDRRPRLVRTGDLDGDGCRDVGLLEPDLKRVLFFRHDSCSRRFLPMAEVATGVGPTDLLLADLDSDGFAEAVTANRDDGTITLVDNLAGTLAPALFSPFAVQARPFSLGLLEGFPPFLLVFETSSLFPLVLPAPPLLANVCPLVQPFLPYRPGKLLVGFDKPKRREALIQELEAAPLSLTVAGALDEIDVLIVGRVTACAEAIVAAQLRKLKGVVFAEPDYLVFGHQSCGALDRWGLDAIDVDPAWAATPASSAVTIAVLDSGIEDGHPDLAGLVRVNDAEDPGDQDDEDGNLVVDDVRGANLIDGFWERAETPKGTIFPWVPTASAEDDHGDRHGTRVAATAAAARSNGCGIDGVAPVLLEAVKVLDSGNTGTSSSAAHGILYAVRRGADVVNLSLGGLTPSQTLARATALAGTRGLVVVASAGNRADIEVEVPARHGDVVGVGAVDRTLAVAPFSNRGLGLDVVAPGDCAVVAEPASCGAAFRSGTSFAAPLASGVAALIRSLDWSLAPKRVQAWLRATTDDVGAGGADVDSGYGLLQAGAAVARAVACVGDGGGACRARPKKESPPELAVRFRGAFDLDCDGNDDAVWVDGGGFASAIPSD